MTVLTYITFAGSLLVLFMTPGPGTLAMVSRTLNGGPSHGVIYGLGITTGDIFWLTIAITGLSAAAGAASDYQAWYWIAKVIGAGILCWFASSSFKSFKHPKPLTHSYKSFSKTGLLASYIAGVAMPLSNPKAIVFYLSFLPAFFDLSIVTGKDYIIMVVVLIAMACFFIASYVSVAHRARVWLSQKGIKRWADLLTAIIMMSVAIVLLVR